MQWVTRTDCDSMPYRRLQCWVGMITHVCQRIHLQTGADMATVDSYETKTLGKLWRVRYRTPDNKQTMERGFKTKRDATQWMNAMENAKSKGDYVGSAAGRVTLADLSQRWFDAQVHLKATTRSNYRHSLDKHVLPMWGHRQIASIGHGEVQSWITLLSRTLSPASVRVPYQTLNSVLKYGC